MKTTKRQAHRLFYNLMDSSVRSEVGSVHRDGWTFRTRTGVVHYLAKEGEIVTAGQLDKLQLQYVRQAEYHPPEPVLWPFEASPHRAPRWA